MLLSNKDWPEVEFFKSDPPGRNESDRKSAKMQKNGKTKTFLDKAPKSFLQRFMKQDLSVMKAVAVSFQMAPAVSKYMAYKGQNEYFCEHFQLSRIWMNVNWYRPKTFPFELEQSNFLCVLVLGNADQEKKWTTDSEDTKSFIRVQFAIKFNVFVILLHISNTYSHYPLF